MLNEKVWEVLSQERTRSNAPVRSRSNEEQWLRLGLTVEKEDGQSEDLICQLKSTDASSIRVVKQDLDTLQHNAHVSHKLPVFAIQFLQSNEVYVVLKPEVLEEVAQYLQTGVVERHETEFDEVIEHAPAPSPKKTIRSSSSAREAFAEEHQAKYRKKGRSAT